MKTDALVVVDMQNDFITGSLGSEDAQLIVPRVKQKIAIAQQNETAIIATADLHFDDYMNTLEGRKLPIPHCIQGSFGQKICEEIISQLYKAPFHLVSKITFGAEDLPQEVRYFCNLPGRNEYEPQHIEICGLCTDICVIANAIILRSAFPNTLITVDRSACAGTSREAHNATLQVMKSLQIDVF